MTTQLGPFPEPSVSAGPASRAPWERRVARNYEQYLQGDVPIKVLERRYGKTRGELAAIAERNGVAVNEAHRGRKAA